MKQPSYVEALTYAIERLETALRNRPPLQERREVALMMIAIRDVILDQQMQQFLHLGANSGSRSSPICGTSRLGTRRPDVPSRSSV